MRTRSKVTPVRRLLMFLVATALAAVGVVGVAGTAEADTGGYPYASYNGPGTNPAGSYWTDSSGNPNSPYGYVYRNCTDFDAWKLATANGFNLPHGIGNAANWGVWAQQHGYVVNNTPAPGAVAWWGAYTLDQGFNVREYGHVAWVASVNSNGSANIQEYNKYVNGVPDGAFHTRTIVASGNQQVQYIHFKDINNPPAAAWGGVGNATFLGRNSLTSGMTLHANEYILSADGRFVLLMQQDGNLALYTASGLMWSTHTSGNPWAYLGMQGDGNMVLYNGNATAVLWTTNPRGITKLMLQDDGNLVAYNASNVAVWASNTDVGVGGGTYKGTNVLSAGMTLTRGQYLRSPDKRFFAMVFADGTVGLYAPGGRMTWIAPNTTGSPWDYVGVQGDGNVVIYNGNATAVLWATGQLGIVRLQLQNDGNLVAYNASNVAVWASNTDGHL